MKIFTVTKGMPVRVASTAPTAAVSSDRVIISSQESQQFERGVAVSVLPPDVQRRLRGGEQISSEELEGLQIDVVK